MLTTCVSIQQVKPLKFAFFGPKMEFFLTEITKADHQLSEIFYFIKMSYVLTEL